MISGIRNRLIKKEDFDVIDVIDDDEDVMKVVSNEAFNSVREDLSI